MGAAIGAVVSTRVIWASEGRSEDTKRRAKSNDLEDVVSLENLVSQSDLLVSVCPPSASHSVARSVAGLDFRGIYVDANAVSPTSARRMSGMLERFVDGGIVGPPPVGPGTTRLYLSGAEAGSVATAFDESHLEARVIGDSPGSASALKMAYAAWTKGSSALLLAVLALAQAEEVRVELAEEWAMSLPDLVSRAEKTASPVVSKAWRFSGEMREIADTFEDANLPDGFHRAAEEVYSRIASMRGETTEATVDDVVTRLLEAGKPTF